VKTSTVIILVAGLAVVGGIAFVALRKPSGISIGAQGRATPPLNTQTGAANTPAAQFASLAGQAGSILATQGVKALEKLFN